MENNEKNDEFYMEQALAEAQKAFDKGEIPVGAIIVHNNRIIAKAHNLTETLTDVTAHAEMQAITAAANTIGGKYLSNCTLYVTLEPCIMCGSALGWSQISKIVFGANDEKKGFRTFSPNVLHPKTIVIGGIKEKECATLLIQFFLKKRK